MGFESNEAESGILPLRLPMVYKMVYKASGLQAPKEKALRNYMLRKAL